MILTLSFLSDLVFIKTGKDRQVREKERKREREKERRRERKLLLLLLSQPPTPFLSNECAPYKWGTLEVD
jgi:hypothetical protein